MVATNSSVRRILFQFNCFKRWLKTTTALSEVGGIGSVQPNALRAVLSEAECRLQCPPAHPFVRNLLSQDLGGLAASLRSLAGTKHPLVEEAKRSLLFSAVGGGVGGNSIRASSAAVGQTRRAVVLLVARAHEDLLTKGSDLHDLELLRRRQCQLADIADSVHTALSIHSRIVQPSSSDLAKGNALATLAGDYLLASASLGLAELDRPVVVKLIAEAICDIVAGRFSPVVTASADGDQTPASLTDWQDYVRLTSASLLSKSIQSALILASSPDISLSEDQSTVHQCEIFSKSFAVLLQAYKEQLDLIDNHNGASYSSSACWPLERIKKLNNGDEFLKSHIDTCHSVIDAWPSNGYHGNYLRQIVTALAAGPKLSD